MKLMKRTTLAVAVVSMLAFSVQQAAAQPPYTPTLSVTVNGNNATIQWTRVNEAEGYTVQAGYAPGAAPLSQNVPASITGGTLKGVPNGVYYLRVRAYAGPHVGPWSNEVVAVVPGVVCTPPAAPMAGAEVNGATVTIGWSPGAGAPGVVVEQDGGDRQVVLDGGVPTVGPMLMCVRVVDFVFHTSSFARRRRVTDEPARLADVPIRG